MAYQGRKLVIGVDGGGTKTLGVLMDGDGNRLAEAAAGSSNPHSNSAEAVRSALHGLFNDLVTTAGVRYADLDGVCLGMAGCDRPADKEFITGIAREVLGDTLPLEIVNDAVVAMMAVLGKLHGILLIAGTGSICLGYNSAGEMARCGGWGHVLADEGSGYMIGVEALKAVLGEYDQRTKATALTRAVLGTLKLESPTDLVGWTYMMGKTKTDIAALAPLVHDAAKAGDMIAHEILLRQASLLAEQVETVYKRLFGATKERVPLVLWGGNLLRSSTYQGCLLLQLQSKDLPIDPVAREADAMVGAAKYMLTKL